ncbi:hypothetical protein F5B21DRAFT_472512 [Xylaria acuta]|nr:hypothetical protein F5B21DRAFT_472512 [Xylaria acuta]
MNNRESIFSWIQGLPEHTTSRPTELNKRMLVHQEQQLASPPASLETGNENNMTSTPKRGRFEGSDGGSEPDVTPRAFADNIPSLSDISSIASGKSVMFWICKERKVSCI